ncbi:MAG: transposase [Candidatus Omnitrophica bacterium]|nr:transposase [Candidatus Omnitrophota bacterium]
MPSYARRHQLSNSLIYHVFNRSNARAFIFQRPEDFKHFMELLRFYARKFNLRIYHWVIMSNHYHLLLELDEPGLLSKIMSGLNRAYTHYSHKTYKSSGLLWQGRFKSQPVQKENYILACGRYIERNPLAANIVGISQASDYPYSSARFYCLGISDGLTLPDQLYLELGDNDLKRQSKYKQFLRNFDQEEEKLFANLEAPAGNIEFIKRLVWECGRLMPRRAGNLRK